MTVPYTKTPNEIIEAMQSMGEVESRLTAVLVRQTFGWHRKECELTWDDMVRLTGMSRGSVAKAMDAVDERGFFRRGRKSKWAVNSAFDELFKVQNVDYSSNYELNEEQEVVDESSNFELSEVDESSKFELSEVDESSKFELPSFKQKKTPTVSKKQKKGACSSKPSGHPVWEMPNRLKTPEFEDAWVLWFRHLIDKGSYLGQVAGEVELARLAEWGSDRAVEAIKHSVRRQWLSIHEPNVPVPRGSPSPASSQTQGDIINAALSDLGGF
ncbi:MAG: replication protein [Anaerolineae bacterium]|nr:replication protein [Anaerolineae bacterium]